MFDGKQKNAAILELQRKYCARTLYHGMYRVVHNYVPPCVVYFQVSGAQADYTIRKSIRFCIYTYVFDSLAIMVRAG
jgi:hypothetical protein